MGPRTRNWQPVARSCSTIAIVRDRARTGVNRRPPKHKRSATGHPTSEQRLPMRLASETERNRSIAVFKERATLAWKPDTSMAPRWPRRSFARRQCIAQFEGAEKSTAIWRALTHFPSRSADERNHATRQQDHASEQAIANDTCLASAATSCGHFRDSRHSESDRRVLSSCASVRILTQN